MSVLWPAFGIFQNVHLCVVMDTAKYLLLTSGNESIQLNFIRRW